MAAAVFWASALLVLHTYVFYPAILVGLSALRSVRADLRWLLGGGERRKLREPETLPGVSVVVAAWNEAKVIGAKLENSLRLDYPADRLEIVVGSDGSDDGTDDIVASCRDRRVRLAGSAQRAGKVSVLNRTVPTAHGEIVVLSDANTMYQPDAVRKLVRHFADPAVGCVCGNLRLYNPHDPHFEESAYWKYESFLKLLEGRFGAVMGANGGIYAIRRRLFTQLPPNTIVDDFVIALRCLQQGTRIVYDPEAIAYEETTEDYGKERGRRVRIAAGNFQSLGLVGDLLHPRHGLVAFAFASHKLLRWLVPFLLALCLVSSATLAAEPLYAAALAAQLALYGLAGLAVVAKLPGRLGRLASLCRYFVEMNVGLFQGFVRYVRRTQKVTWARTARA